MCIQAESLEVSLDETIMDSLNYKLNQLPHDTTDRRRCLVSIAANLNQTGLVIQFDTSCPYAPITDHVIVESNFTFEGNLSIVNTICHRCSEHSACDRDFLIKFVSYNEWISVITNNHQKMFLNLQDIIIPRNKSQHNIQEEIKCYETKDKAFAVCPSGKCTYLNNEVDIVRLCLPASLVLTAGVLFSVIIAEENRFRPLERIFFMCKHSYCNTDELKTSIKNIIYEHYSIPDSLYTWFNAAINIKKTTIIQPSTKIHLTTGIKMKFSTISTTIKDINPSMMTTVKLSSALSTRSHVPSRFSHMTSTNNQKTMLTETSTGKRLFTSLNTINRNFISISHINRTIYASKPFDQSTQSNKSTNIVRLQLFTNIIFMIFFLFLKY